MQTQQQTGKVIGLNLSNEDRTEAWQSMIETKISHRMFSNSKDPEEMAIANLDMKVYNHFMNKYLQ